LSAKNYHHVFIPLPEIYAEAGPDVFSNLESQEPGRRNCLVLPTGFDLELSQSPGGREALRHLNRFRGKRLDKSAASEYADGELPKDCAVFRASEGLDVAYVQTPETEFNYKGFFAMVRNHWTGNDDLPRVVTMDERMALRYGSFGGVKVEKPGFLIPSAGIVNRGLIAGNDDLLSRLMSNSRSVPLDVASGSLGLEDELFLNQFVYFPGAKPQYAVVEGDIQRSRTGTRILGVGDLRLRLLRDKEYSKKISVGEHVRDNVLGISPREMEQYLALQYGLFNPDVELLFLPGTQGSGKTILTYVAAVDQVLHYNTEMRKARGLNGDQVSMYDKVILVMPNDTLGGSSRDVGFLPGDLLQKLKPHLGPIEDAHNESSLIAHLTFKQMFLDAVHRTDFGAQRGFKGKVDSGNCKAGLSERPVLEIAHIGHLRGRSIPRSLIMVDEAQNLTPYEMKTLIERAAEGTKIIVTGDPIQSDRGTIDRNGLTWAISKFLYRPYTALINLTKNNRNQASEDTRGLRVYSGSN
jgi:hypothetical protein